MEEKVLKKSLRDYKSSFSRPLNSMITVTI